MKKLSTPSRWKAGPILAVLIGAHAQAAAGADGLEALGEPDFKNSVWLGSAFGFSVDADAPSFSFSGTYERALGGPWGAYVGLGWEQEYRDVGAVGRLRGQSLDLGFGASYAATDRIGLSLGASKTLRGWEEGAGWSSVAADDAWSIDFGIGYSFDLSERVSWGPSVTFSYGVNSDELLIYLDIGVGYAF